MNTDHKNIIEANLFGIETKLQRCDKQIQLCLSNIFNNTHSISQSTIDNALNCSKNILTSCINNQRQYLIAILRTNLNQNLESLNTKRLMALKLKTPELLHRLTSSLIGNLYYVADFLTIRHRLAYLSFLDLAKEFIINDHEGDRLSNVLR